MKKRFLVTDTHPLIWFISDQDSRLPRSVMSAFEAAESGGGTHIWVPMAVAWEISLLMRKTNRIKGLGTFEELLAENFFSNNISLVELHPKDLALAHSLQFNRDPFDALIVATALRMDLPLITGDQEITSSQTCQIFWNKSKSVS